MYNSKDMDRILIAIQNEREFESFCKNVLEMPDILNNNKFNNNVNRCANRKELDEIIQNVFSQHSVDKLIDKLELSNIAFANVNTMKGLSSHGALTRINVPTEDGMRNVVAPAAKFNGKHREMRKVPSLGEHNEVIREEFGGGRGKE